MRVIPGFNPPARSRGDETYTLLSYNVGFASGLANRRAIATDREFYAGNLAKIIEAAAGAAPDFIAVQEIDIDSHRSYHQDQVAELGLGVRAAWSAFLSNCNKRYIPFPYWPPSMHYGRTNSGLALISKFPVSGQKRVSLAPPGSKPFYFNAFYLDRCFQVVTVNTGTGDLVVINVHLEAFDQEARENQARKLLDVFRCREDVPVIIAGDFNCPPPFSNRLRSFPDDCSADADDYTTDTTMKILLEEPSLRCGLDTARYLLDEAGSFTYRSDEPSRTLDYIFFNRHVEPLEYRVLCDAGKGSDHLPVLLKFRIK